MEQYFPILLQCALFAGLSTAQLSALLSRLGVRMQAYAKDEILLMAGYESRAIGIVLSGCISAAKTTVDGAQVMLTQMEAGGIFGDVLAGSHAKSPVTVSTLRPTTVLWLPAEAILQGGSGDCTTHALLLQNLVGLISDKYFQLSARVDLLLLKSPREKVLHYLRHEALAQADGSRLVPLTRAAWAAHLGCERSALCRELGRMREERLLRVEKRVFWLL